MSIVSMNDLLKGRRSSRRAGAPVILRMDWHKAIQKYYMRFTLNDNLVQAAGWEAGSYINFVWDTEKKQAILESATATTGRVLTANKHKTRYIIRYPYIKGFGLPFPKESVEGYNVKVRTAKVSFYLNVKEEKDVSV